MCLILNIVEKKKKFMYRSEAEPVEAPPSSTEVLDSLINPKGVSMSEKISEILVNDSVRFAMVFGPPESGKTTIAIQLARKLAEHPITPRLSELMTFDDAIAQARDRYSLGPIPYWGGSEWRMASHFYFQQIEAKLSQTDPNKLIIIENVGYGDTDRGISTTLNLAANHSVEGFFWGLVQHPAISRQALSIRHRLLEENGSGNFSIPDEEVLNFLLANNLLISGTGNLSISESGRIVRDIVAKMDLSEEEQLTADTEEKEKALIDQAVTFERIGFPTGINRLSERREGVYVAAREAVRLQGTRIPQLPPVIQNSGISSIDAEEMNFQANHLRIFGAKLSLVHNLSPHRYDYFFNGIIKNKPIHYLDLEILLRK